MGRGRVRGIRPDPAGRGRPAAQLQPAQLPHGADGTGQVTPLPRHFLGRLLAVAVAAGLVIALSSCSVVTSPLSAPGSYHVTAYFARAVSFYPGSRVQVMG